MCADGMMQMWWQQMCGMMCAPRDLLNCLLHCLAADCWLPLPCIAKHTSFACEAHKARRTQQSIDCHDRPEAH